MPVAACPAPLAPLHARPTSPLPRAVITLAPEETNFKHDKRVACYWLGKKLGEGAFAKVKEGMHRPTGEKVALKIIDKKKARADKYVSLNMRREAKLMTMICHPNVLRLLDEVETENSYYLVTEMAEGGDLMDHIYKHNYLPEDEVRRYISQIISAVDHIHKAGIIHRDLKIENLLLDADHNIKIIDFGLSNTIRPLSPSRPAENHCKTQCGSPAYAAPELLGREEYGVEVDIWSIGVNLFAMLTGTLPFTVDPFNITELHAKMLSRRMNPIPDHLRVSADCQDLLRRLLNPSRARRIKMPEIFVHPWLNSDHAVVFEPVPFPNTPTYDGIDERVLHHMSARLQFPAAKVTGCVVSNKACSSSATYHLLYKRLVRYQKQHPEVARRKKGLTRQRRRSILPSDNSEGGDVPIINEDELLETVHLPTGLTNGLPGLKRDAIERQSSSSQRSVPCSNDELSPSSEIGSLLTSPQGATPQGAFSPVSLSDEDEAPWPMPRTESVGSRTRPHEARTMRKVTSTPSKITPPAKSRIPSVNTSSLPSPGSPRTPEGHAGAPTPKALKKGVEQAFAGSREKSTSTWLPPAIDTASKRSTVGSRRNSMPRLQENQRDSTPVRRVIPSSFGKAVSDVRSSQGSRIGRPESWHEDQLSPPSHVKTNTFFQNSAPENVVLTPLEGRARGSRRNSVVDELGGAPPSILPALNPRGSISAGKRPMSKNRSLNSVASRPHTTGTAAGAPNLRPATQHGNVGVKLFTIESLDGVPKPHIVHQVLTTLNTFRDIESVAMDGHTIRCVCYDVVLEISVPDGPEDTCSIKFERVGNGGNRLRYNEICDQIVKALKVVA